MMGIFTFSLQRKDFVRGATKYLDESESQKKAWHIAMAFAGVDALAGDAHKVGQLLLGPPSCIAKLFDPVVDPE
jgi:hypothetical protein